MKNLIMVIIFSVFTGFHSFCQRVAISEDGSVPHNSAMLDIKSSNKGLLIPRMSSAERIGISSPAFGLLVYDNETASFWYYKVAGWTELISGGAGANSWTVNGNDIFNNNTGNVGIGINAPLAPLHIKNDNEALRIEGATPYISFKDSTDVLKGFLQNFNNDLYLGTPSTNVTGKMEFYLKNLPLMTITPTGNVGIGTTTPGQKLTVQTPNNSYGISHISDQGNILATNIGGTSAGIGTFSYTNMRIFSNSLSRIFVAAATGNVGIGTDNPTSKLSVVGNVRAYEVVVENNWADYVFDEAYNLPLLSEVEKFIQLNKHLPNIPSAKEIKEKGLSVGDTQKRMMEKIEELTLYMIEANKKIEALEQLLKK